MNEQADRSQLSQTYYQEYDRIRALPEAEVQLLISRIRLQEKDDRIRSLERLLANPRFHVDNLNSQGGIMSESQNTVNIDGNFSGIASAGGANTNQITGNITQTITQLRNSGSPEVAHLADLLQQLQTLISTSSDLDDTTKADALEQIQDLTQAAQDPQAPPHQKIAKTAISAIKGILSVLSPTNQLIAQSTVLLEGIGKLFR